MKLTLNDNDGRFIIRSYEAGQITVNDASYGQSVIVTPTRIVDNWPPRAVDELAADHFEQMDRREIELVILGTGERQQFPAAQVLEPLIRQGIGYEIMDTHAACRTYNILVGEDRRVAAALIIE